MMAPRTADELRRAFLDFFEERAHIIVPSASLIPHDPTVLFTNAGMIPFKPYFLGEEAPPYTRAASVQKCVRAGGKHNDLEEVGRTNRHLTFFEMLGNFSFGDYFKLQVIPWAWELVTGVFGLDPDRLWVTIHESDDEADEIWRDTVGVPAKRVQRLGDDNFWRMADTGPCGPSSEIFLDLGADHGEAGGPAHGSADRYLEFWNLVFMQYDAQPDGELLPLPKPGVDTGAGLERTLAVLQGVDTVFEIDVFQPLLTAAQAVTGTRYGAGGNDNHDVSLRILAEHGRAMTFIVGDGVVPSNEQRGYVLRRLIRRAVRHAYLLGVRESITPPLVAATVEAMGGAYPELVRRHDEITTIVQREEQRFAETLERGLQMLDELLADGDVSGDDAFYLHDTLGFPIDLTREIAEERGRAVDLTGYDTRMAEQRARAKEAHKATAPGDVAAELRDVLDTHGATEFTGRQEYVTPGARVLALLVNGRRVERADADDDVDVVLDRTPFYAEAGGQVGDTGALATSDGRAQLEVIDTQYLLPGLVGHRARVVAGPVAVGDELIARIDAERRDRIRRNHTATHVLHWALRAVLGPHVKQAGSLVAPDRLRFDFQHYEAVTPAQLDDIEAVANAEIITDAPVRHYETTREHAESVGAIAFFGEKYGDLVRVLEAGEHSVELCGGTHVHALGFIGPIKITSESSIGANLRRIEAVTGDAALARIHDEELTLRRAAAALRVAPDEVPERVEQLVAQVKTLNKELSAARQQETGAEAAELAAGAVDGVVVATRDGLAPDELKQLVASTRDRLGSGVVAVLGKAADGAKAGIAVGVTPDLVAGGVSAAEIARPAAQALGGGTAKNAELVVGGGPKADALPEALALVREAAAAALSGRA
jgi:alanyl-tRNA synthetase